MATDKKGFMLYADQQELFNQLSNEQAGELIKHVFSYVNDENPKTDSLIINLAFTPIKQQLKRDLKKWEQRADRSRENGAKGGRPLKPKEPSGLSGLQNKPKEPVTVNVNVTDTVNVNDNVNVKEKDINTILLSEIKISDVEDKLKDYFEIAKAFQGLFIKNLTEKNSSYVNQKNAKFGNYVDPIRLMMTKDEITKEQLTSVFKYLDSPQGEFWKPNILSTSKLREKFQQLIMKANEKSKNGQVNTIGNTGVSAEYLQRIQDELQS